MRGKYLALFLILACSCHFGGTSHKGKLLAKVGGAELYDDDLKTQLAHEADSAQIKRKFVDNWVRTQLVYKKAVASLSETEKNKDKELKNYYESLIRYYFLEKMASQHADTIVSEKNIEDYYQSNLKNFELKRNIIRFLYVKLPIDIKVNPRLEQWMEEPVKRNMDSLKVFVARFASNSLLDTVRWYYFSDITKEIPILQDYNPEHFIKSNNFIRLKDDRYNYYLNIVDGRINEETAPLQLVKERIRSIIINQRKINRQKELENSIYKEAEARHLFEIY